MERVALVAGVSLVDVVATPDDPGGLVERPGGWAADAAVALARLGRRVRLATALAEDAHGALLREHLAAGGVRLVGDPVVLPRTSTTRTTLDESGPTTHELDVAWRLGPLDLAGTEPLVVVCGSIGAVLPPGADQVRDLVADLGDRASVVYDVAARPALLRAEDNLLEGVTETAALADVVTVSEEDLADLWPGLTVDEAARHLLSMGPASVVVTPRTGGARWLTRHGGGRVPASGDVVKAAGAGAPFGAALVDALWERGLLGAGREALAATGAGTWAAALDRAARSVSAGPPGATRGRDR